MTKQHKLKKTVKHIISLLFKLTLFCLLHFEHVILACKRKLLPLFVRVNPYIVYILHHFKALKHRKTYDLHQIQQLEVFGMMLLSAPFISWEIYTL